MDRKTLIKIAVGVLILIFLLEPIAITIANLGGFGNRNEREEFLTSTALFNMILDSYNGYIVIPMSYEDRIEEIESYPYVLSVTKFSDSIVIETSNVYEAYKNLKANGINGSSEARLRIESINIGNEQLVSVSSIDATIEPLIEPNTSIQGQGEVIYSSKSKQVLQIGQITPLLETREVEVNFKVMDVEEKGYIYVIDWENRTKIKKDFEDKFEINNVVLVEGNPMEKQEFVEILGRGYIIVKDDFNDKEEVEKYYDVIEFKDTIIETNETLSIDYAKNSSVLYKVYLENEELKYKLEIESEKNYSVGDEIKLNLTGIFSNNKLIYLIE